MSFALLFLATAMASEGTLVIKEGNGWPVYVWVDGEAVGKIKKSHETTVPAGVHEVWYAADEKATLTYCHGLVDVPAGGSVELKSKAMKCTGFTELDKIGEKTAFKGVKVSYTMPEPENMYAFSVIVDGLKETPVGPKRSLNLAPGKYPVIVGWSARDGIIEQGMLDLTEGDTASMTITSAGCIELKD